MWKAMPWINGDKMKWVCKHHERFPNQTEIMSCDDCNTCDNCKKAYYNDFEEESGNDTCPYCGEVGRA